MQHCQKVKIIAVMVHWLMLILGTELRFSLIFLQLLAELLKVASKQILQSCYMFNAFQSISFIHCLPIWSFLIMGRKIPNACNLQAQIPHKELFQEYVIVVRTFRACWSFKASHDVLHFSSK